MHVLLDIGGSRPPPLAARGPGSRRPARLPLLALAQLYVRGQPAVRFLRDELPEVLHAMAVTCEDEILAIDVPEAYLCLLAVGVPRDKTADFLPGQAWGAV